MRPYDLFIKEAAGGMVPFDGVFAFQQLRKMREGVGAARGIHQGRVLRAGGVGAVVGGVGAAGAGAVHDHHQGQEVTLGQTALRAAEGAFIGGAAGAGGKAVLDLGRQGAAAGARMAADAVEATKRTARPHSYVMPTGHAIEVVKVDTDAAHQAFHNIRTNPDIAAIGDFEGRYGRKAMAQTLHPDHLAHAGIDEADQTRINRAYQLYNGIGGNAGSSLSKEVESRFDAASGAARLFAVKMDQAQEGLF